MLTFPVIVAFVIGAAASFAITRIANKLNGTDTIKADYAWLQNEYNALVAKFKGDNTSPPAA